MSRALLRQLAAHLPKLGVQERRLEVATGADDQAGTGSALHRLLLEALLQRVREAQDRDRLAAQALHDDADPYADSDPYGDDDGAAGAHL